MADLETLQQQLDTLRAYRAKGTQTTTLGNGESVTFKSDAQMAEAIADLEQRIASLSGRQVRMVRFACGKGV
ncbi:hypothetical protein C8J27_1159 [Rhodobacter aestuarii]|uniref:GpW protein n=1 Tax=Rhodobacter aestuarii TaxID=453582 RepID=A0A1N7QF80_9RHOB|nr:hypothetical protein [Rhodobacter aestuarii]PTV93496.1 hypothetical protein C8J27_1159 [Rhodobacter aestuarii]SIT21541.1 hypothetical protein SAMN05421580_11732 [Rhodobacter aestuarii]